MRRYYLPHPRLEPVPLAPGQPSPIGGTWRPAAYTDAIGQTHHGLACEQAGPKCGGRRLRGFRFSNGQLADVLASAVKWTA